MRDEALRDELVALTQRIDEAQRAAVMSDERETLAAISALLERNPPGWEEARPLHEAMKARQASLREAIEAARRAAGDRLATVIAEHGWPGQGLVGIDGASAAARIAQSANHDVELQRRCLVLLEAAVTAEEASASQYAYLFDRLAVQEGRPQRFGTEMKGGKPYPVEAPEHLDERREAVGLEPFADFQAWLAGMLGGDKP